MHIKDLIPWARHGEAAPSRAMQPGTGEHPMAELQRQMNQVFESFWSRMDRPFAGGGWPFGDQGPRSDVVETADGIEVTVELPGMEQKDVEISVERRVLTVRGRARVTAPQGYRLVYAEYGEGDYERSFTLSQDIDEGRIAAEMKNGVLTLTLPRAEAVKPRKIEVKAA